LIALVAPRLASAQNATSFGSIAGVVGDSLRAEPLREAVVMVERLNRSTTAGIDGTFRIDSVPAGRWRLVVFHPLLDSLHISLVTRDIDVAAGGPTNLIVTTPSPLSLLKLKCDSTSAMAIIGEVSSGDGSSSPKGAAVHLWWTETTISKVTGIRNTRRESVAPVDENGAFRICNVPAGVSGKLFAVSNADTTQAIAVSFDETPLLLTGLRFAGSDVQRIAAAEGSKKSDKPRKPGIDERGMELPSVSELRRGQATVTGVVKDLEGKPVANVRMSVEGAVGSSRTDSSGNFRLLDQPSGSGMIRAQKLGLSMVEVPITLSSATSTTVSISMSTAAAVLPSVIIREFRTTLLAKTGFFERKQRRPGNTFWGPEDMERMASAYDLTSVLRRAPNLRYGGGQIGGRPRGYSVAVGGGRDVSASVNRTCVSYMVDGDVPFPGDNPIEYLSPSDVAAIEVYFPYEAPPTIKGGLRLNRDCETVIIWTRYYLNMNMRNTK
jgi:hypothetical protein